MGDSRVVGGYWNRASSVEDERRLMHGECAVPDVESGAELVGGGMPEPGEDRQRLTPGVAGGVDVPAGSGQRPMTGHRRWWPVTDASRSDAR
jgi:hypothetical protein